MYFRSQWNKVWILIRLLHQMRANQNLQCFQKKINLCSAGQGLTLNAPIATKVVCFSRLLKCLRSLYGKQCGPRSDCSYRSRLFWSKMFASILNLLGIYLQQTTSADDIFKCILLGASRVNIDQHQFSGGTSV